MCAQSADSSVTLLSDYSRAARALSLTEQALRDLVWKGRVPIVTVIGRRRLFAVSDLEEFVNSHRKPSLSLAAASDSFLPGQRVRAKGRTLRHHEIFSGADRQTVESQLTEKLRPWWLPVAPSVQGRCRSRSLGQIPTMERWSFAPTNVPSAATVKHTASTVVTADGRSDSASPQLEDRETCELSCTIPNAGYGFTPAHSPRMHS